MTSTSASASRLITPSSSGGWPSGWILDGGAPSTATISCLLSVWRAPGRQPTMQRTWFRVDVVDGGVDRAEVGRERRAPVLRIKSHNRLEHPSAVDPQVVVDV